MKELIIDKNTNINIIANKEDYTSLILKTKINPKKLVGFNNVKELTIDYNNKQKINYNESTINKLPFKENIEKLIFRSIKSFGKGKNKKYDYKLELPNLKSITFPRIIENYNGEYLEDCEKLEEIIINTNNVNHIFISDVIYLYSSNFKRIIINHNDEQYIKEPEYIIGYLDDIDFDDDNIIIEYSNDDENINSEVIINTINKKIKTNNIFDIDTIDYKIYIPDYITELNGYSKKETHKVSFNLNLLNHITICKELISSNNEMSLFPSININIKEHGELEALYLEDNLLYLEYDTCILEVNSKGEIKTIVKQKYKEEQKNNDLILKKYTLEELEKYVSYLKLLKLSENKEYKEAMKVVEKELVKKLTK